MHHMIIQFQSGIDWSKLACLVILEILLGGVVLWLMSAVESRLMDAEIGQMSAETA